MTTTDFVEIKSGIAVIISNDTRMIIVNNEVLKEVKMLTNLCSVGNTN